LPHERVDDGGSDVQDDERGEEKFPTRLPRQRPVFSGVGRKLAEGQTQRNGNDGRKTDTRFLKRDAASGPVIPDQIANFHGPVLAAPFAFKRERFYESRPRS
jgi:hypothetical protein